MNSFAEILLIAIFMSAACAPAGNFLVLRRMSMLTDAISHTVLPRHRTRFPCRRQPGFALPHYRRVPHGCPYSVADRTPLPEQARRLRFRYRPHISPALQYRRHPRDTVRGQCPSGHGLHPFRRTCLCPFDRLIINGTDFGAKGLYTGGAALILSAAVISLFIRK